LSLQIQDATKKVDSLPLTLYGCFFYCRNVFLVCMLYPEQSIAIEDRALAPAVSDENKNFSGKFVRLLEMD